MPRLKKFDFVEIETDSSIIIAILLTKRRDAFEILPIFKFDTPEDISDIICKITLLRSSVKKINRLSKKHIDQIIYLLGINNNIIKRATERVLDERTSNRKN